MSVEILITLAGRFCIALLNNLFRNYSMLQDPPLEILYSQRRKMQQEGDYVQASLLQ